MEPVVTAGPLGNGICGVVRESAAAAVEGAIALARHKVAALELRLDYLDPSALTLANVSHWVRLAECPVVLTLRRKPNGGEFPRSDAEQVQTLTALRSSGASFIDLEIETIEGYLRGDLGSIRQGDVRWIASYHDFERTPEDLNAIFRRLAATQADAFKVATLARSFTDNFRLLELTKTATREGSPMICAAMGEIGTLTRVLAPSAGSLWTYGSLARGLESAPGQFTVAELTDLYAIDRIDALTQVYGVIGNPISHSLSPHIHNPAFRQAGLNARYLPVPVQDLTDFARHLGRFAGLSVTIPHKVRILEWVDACDDSVRLTGAANTVVKRGDQFVAFNTDLDGVRCALREPLDQKIHRATLLGTGGAARAAAWVLKQAECAVMVLARDSQKARAFAVEFGFEHDALSRAERHRGDLLINATPVGMFPHVDETPIPKTALNYRYVFDMVYNPLETRLMREGRVRAKVISGLEMFIEQAARQFELWTGQPAPRELMRKIVLEKLQS